MIASLPDQTRRWVIRQVGAGSRIVAARRLSLGGWHVNHALDVVDGAGRRHRFVLRRWARVGWELEDPDYTVDRELGALALVGATGVSVPEVVAADREGSRCDVPALLLTWMRGHPPRPVDARAEGFCRQLAETLARVHDTPGARGRIPVYRLYFDRERAALPAWMPVTATWRRATAAVREPPPLPASLAFIHRDFHPENTLWWRGRLSGVVDWTQASWGPPALDLGHMRWNLVLDHGRRVADRFRDAYRACTGAALADQAYWDLVSLLDLLLAGGDDPGDLDRGDLRRLEDYARGLLAAAP